MAYDFGYEAFGGKSEENHNLVERAALCGSLIYQNPIPMITADKIEGSLERGSLFLGASGTGKTNGINLLNRFIDEQNPHGCMKLFFDPKGDYLEEHLKSNSTEELYVIGSGAEYKNITKYWNIFKEIMTIGTDGKLIYTDDTANEALDLSIYLYERYKSKEQPIFTNMSQQIFAALLVYFVRRYEKTDQKMLNNYEFMEFLKQITAEGLLRILKSEEVRDLKHVIEKTGMQDYQAMIDYISGGKSGNQTQGVLSYLRTMPYEMFIGPFAKEDPKREISIRELVESDKSAAIFLEYDLKRNETLSPIYAFLIDQFLKYAMGGRKKTRRPCYLILDEWARIKVRSKQIENALSMGRSQNLKVICGLQNVNSLKDIYQEEMQSILAGFQTVVGFYVPDSESRKFLTERSGKNYQNLSFTSHNKNKDGQRDGYCLEDWDIQELKCGQAAVMMPGEKPFIYQLPKYEEKGRKLIE